MLPVFFDCYSRCWCGALNENAPHRLMCLNTWYPVSRTVWEGLGGVALLKEMCHWGKLWGQNRPTSWWGSLCELSADPSFWHHGLQCSKAIRLITFSFLSCFGHGSRKVTKTEIGTRKCTIAMTDHVLFWRNVEEFETLDKENSGMLWEEVNGSS